MGQRASTAILVNDRWGSPRSGTVAQFRYTEFYPWGTWASTQALQFWQMNDEAPEDQTQWHNLDIFLILPLGHMGRNAELKYTAFHQSGSKQDFFLKTTPKLGDISLSTPPQFTYI